ncbi:hypothetical protein [Actinomadura parmotrematis]|uniref:Uncharacterized protein n=1 Tax=Actinomadura parmotrematis TaxID=2864039 RepID=A0ABS7FXQ6_9ACTN|nr:hypothetical protein [Actinomadura parmotrematis]MBW8485218.1 hypothetical protein [Actinomadura parmotrematis]
MGRNVRLASVGTVTALACAAGVATAAPALAAGWRNVDGKASTAFTGGLDRVDFASKNVGWAIGSGGSLLSPRTRFARWTSAGWSAQASPVGFAPTDIAVASVSRAWAVGYNLDGVVALYWNGAKWAKVAYPGAGLPSQVAAAADGTAYSLSSLNANSGGLGKVLRWTGSAWADAKVALPASSVATAVDVRSKSDVWLAGTTSTGTAVTGWVMHYNGTSWKRTAVPGSLGTAAYQAVLHKIVAVSATTVYVLRDAQQSQTTNALLRYDGKTWKTANTPLLAAGIGLAADGKGGAVVLRVSTRNKSMYLHYNGTSWSTLYGPVRTGASVQASDIDRRPGTAGVVSVGAAARSGKNSPFIELYG